MFSSQNRLLNSILVPAGITLIGVVGALLLFSRLPQPQTGAAPITPAVAPAITPKTATPATPQVWLTPTADPVQAQSANCSGGDTTLDEAKKNTGFKVLAPSYLPENLQLSLVTMNRMFPEPGFSVVLYYRILMINAARPSLGIYQRLPPASAEPLRLDQKASPIMVRGIQGQLTEPLDPPNTPRPWVTPGPNPTLTAFATGIVMPDMRTAVPLARCPWVSTQITTPIPWTPDPARKAPTPFVGTSTAMLRWVEGVVQITVEGTYGRQELLKVAESLR